MNIPQSRREDITEKIGDITVEDPYRWLEDAEQPEVKQWIADENKYADSLLRTDEQKIFSTELAKNLNSTIFSNPFPRNGRYFYTERRQGEDQGVLYVKNGIDGEPIKLVDPNGKENGSITSLDYWEPDRSGKFVAYGLSKGGDEMSTLYVLDVETKKDLPDTIERCRHSSIQWLPDASGFFYTKNPRAGSVPKNEEHMHVKVYFHSLGTDPEKDELIFGVGRPKDDMIGLSLSLDGEYLAISVSQTWTENEIYLYDREKKETRPLVVGIPAHFALKFLEGKVIIVTDYRANNGRVLSVPLDEIYKPIDNWQEFIPEKEYILDFVRTTKDKLLLCYLVNISVKVSVMDHNGKMLGDIPIPEYSVMAGIGAAITETEFFYGVESFTFPKISYRYDPHADAYSVYRKTENPINPEQYEVKQEWFTSRDGTKVPMFIIHKKDIKKGMAPTVLSGYGGFGSSEEPAFYKSWVSWLERGGIFAIANIRGGGEFGEKWHLDGIKEKKQNSFDDFIAAAEHLIAQGYTDKEHLGITGASNGGLLVSAVAVQRPELFKAVCARVPLTDMVRFPKFGMAVRWIHEYGDPVDPTDLKNILAWSPYHNVREGTEYPAMFFTTADKDSRVDPLHSRKMTALLQSVNKKNPVIIYTETDAGHGSGKPVSKIVDVQSLMLTFFAQELSLAFIE